MEITFRVTLSNYVLRTRIINAICKMKELPNYKIYNEDEFTWIRLFFYDKREKEEFLQKLKTEKIDYTDRL